MLQTILLVAMILISIALTGVVLLQKSEGGALGMGGDTTALAVLIETQPCHIASLPIAVNMQCHSARHKSASV